MLEVRNINAFKEKILASLNRHFETNFTYSLDSTITPSFMMHFLDVYAKDMLIGASLIFLGILFALLAPPSIAALGGIGIGLGAALTTHSLFESSFLYFSPAITEAKPDGDPASILKLA